MVTEEQVVGPEQEEQDPQMPETTAATIVVMSLEQAERAMRPDIVRTATTAAARSRFKETPRKQACLSRAQLLKTLGNR